MNIKFYSFLIIVFVIILMSCNVNKNWKDVEDSIINNEKNNASDTLIASEKDADQSNTLFLVPKASAIKDFLEQDLSITIEENDGIEITFASPHNTETFSVNHRDEIKGILDDISITIDNVKEGDNIIKVIINFSNKKKIECNRRTS